MIALTDSELHELMAAANLVPWDRRDVFLQRVAAELRGKTLGDGLVHRVAYEVARTVAWDAERTAAACRPYNCLRLRRRSREPSPVFELAPWERVLSE